MIHGRYLADGFLLEATFLLAKAKEGSPWGRLLYDGDRVVIFIALAAEAHVNHALATALSKSEWEASKEWRFKEKLQRVRDLTSGSSLLELGREPVQRLLDLIERRNELVHGQPDIWEIKPKESSSKGMLIKVSPGRWGTALPQAAKWLRDLCVYVEALADSDVKTWQDHAYLARELLSMRKALDDWKPKRDGPELLTLSERLVDWDFERDDRGA